MQSYHFDAGAGVTLALTYEIDPRDGAVVFASCRVLGAEYGPVGPDLLDFLHPLAYVQGTTGQSILTLIAEEIMNADRN